MAPSLPLPKLGQIILTEGAPDSLVSKGITFFTKSLWTHAFIVTGPDEAVEARFPRIRTIKLSTRMAALQAAGRAYIVLDLPGLSKGTRVAMAEKARSYVGRFYDVSQIFSYAAFGEFRGESQRTVMCSRMITAAFHAVGEELYDTATLIKKSAPRHRIPNLRAGYATPVDLLFSRLVIVRYHPSVRMPVPKVFV